ncbi:hypothetical protein E308F_25150 [Moorella sp. E308F]|nr:hypothetical protein E308F_25150 [Moorella sp. E308F]GEA17561.1 hypothetical protein E306M_06950 [Moorella sp. E306M]
MQQEKVNLLFRQPDGMDGQEIGIQDSQVGQVLDGGMAAGGFSKAYFFINLGHVHMDAYPVFIGQVLGAFD